MVTTTLKSFASWLLEVDCAVETPVDRRIALLPISVTTPLNRCFGIASIETSAGSPSLTLTMSVSSTFTSAVITEMSAIVIKVLPGAFWMPITTVSPSRTGRLVMTPSNGARYSVLLSTSAACRRFAAFCPMRRSEESIEPWLAPVWLLPALVARWRFRKLLSLCRSRPWQSVGLDTVRRRGRNPIWPVHIPPQSDAGRQWLYSPRLAQPHNLSELPSGPHRWRTHRLPVAHSPALPTFGLPSRDRLPSRKGALSCRRRWPQC